MSEPGRRTHGRETLLQSFSFLKEWIWLWLIHVDVQQKPSQHWKPIILQLKKKDRIKGESNKHAALCRSQTAAWKWRYNFTWVTKQYLAWRRSCQYCLQVFRSILTFMFRKMMMPCTFRQGSPRCDDDWHLKGTVLIHKPLRKTFRWMIPSPHVSVVASVSQGGWVSLVPEVGSDSDDVYSSPLSLGLVLQLLGTGTRKC